MKALRLAAALIGIALLFPGISLGQSPQEKALHQEMQSGKKWIKLPVDTVPGETFRLLITADEACSQRKSPDREICYLHWTMIPSAEEQSLLPGEVQFYNAMDRIWMRVTLRAYCSLKQLSAYNRDCIREWEGLSTYY